MSGLKHAKQSLFNLVKSGGLSLAWSLIATIGRPIAALFGRTNAPLYQPYPEIDSIPSAGSSAPRQTARILQFPAPIPESRPPAPAKAPETASIARILNYTGPQTSSAARSALPMLFPHSSR